MKKIKIIFYILSLFSGNSIAQPMGWQVIGDKNNVSLDSLNARQGKYCLKIGPNAMIVKEFIVSPLSILQFNVYVKCSDEKTRAYSFIRFYDTLHRELLEYKSGPLSSLKFRQTGNYTEAPPFTEYARIGVIGDSSHGYVYADSLEAEFNIGKPDMQNKPLCNLDEYMRPFWKSDTIFNETVLMYSEKNEPAKGSLLFMPSEILSVKSFDLNTEYKKGIDYSIDAGNITRLSSSIMPFRSDTSFDRKNNFAWYNLQSQWVVITYTHHDQWKEKKPFYKGNLMPNTISKLKSGSPLKIVAYGMSITRGLNVSSYDSIPPYMPTYIELFARELQKKYNNPHIAVYNAGLPGALVSWGADYADKYINPLNPDLVIIDFGMNDFWRYTPEEFKKYIQIIINKVKAGNVNTEFLLLANMDFDPDYILDSDKNKHFYVSNMQGYKKVLNEFETKRIISLDMTSLSDILYQKKKARDCISNPLHPNDYMARWYAQSMVALFSK
ncbi:MAG TPA: GDSL-type esterase/lipase family protein [Puia sp.]|nr:GDSL-type esterase/lipase family protein [Puia sp.]